MFTFILHQNQKVQGNTYPVPVDAELAEPVESRVVGHFPLDEFLQDVPGVHLYGHQRYDLQTLVLGQVSTNGFRKLVEHGNL